MYIEYKLGCVRHSILSSMAGIVSRAATEVGSSSAGVRPHNMVLYHSVLW